MHLNKNLIWTILVVEIIITTIEAISAIECHTSGNYGCWSWFFIFLVNLPASIIIADLTGPIIGQLSFYPSVVVTYISFVIVGTIWWAFLGHTIYWLYSLYKKNMGLEDIKEYDMQADAFQMCKKYNEAGQADDNKNV